MLITQNNLIQFIDTKSLSFREVRWAQELSWYNFQIDYHQVKANQVADAFSKFFQSSLEEEETVKAENVKILHRLQSSLAFIIVSNLKANFLYYVIVCRIHVLSQIVNYWNMFQVELVEETFYKVNISLFRLCLPKLQEKDLKVIEI